LISGCKRTLLARTTRRCARRLLTAGRRAIAAEGLARQRDSCMVICVSDAIGEWRDWQEMIVCKRKMARNARPDALECDPRKRELGSCELASKSLVTGLLTSDTPVMTWCFSFSPLIICCKFQGFHDQQTHQKHSNMRARFAAFLLLGLLASGALAAQKASWEHSS
jgi:hypothetical protein